MTEILLKGKKYMGVFNGSKRIETDMVYTEIGKPQEYHHYEQYCGSGIVQHLSNGRRSFFTFSIGEEQVQRFIKRDS